MICEHVQKYTKNPSLSATWSLSFYLRNFFRQQYSQLFVETTRSNAQLLSSSDSSSSYSLSKLISISSSFIIESRSFASFTFLASSYFLLISLSILFCCSTSLIFYHYSLFLFSFHLKQEWQQMFMKM